MVFITSNLKQWHMGNVPVYMNLFVYKTGVFQWKTEIHEVNKTFVFPDRSELLEQLSTPLFVILRI
jgi:hypothetical protein